MRILLRPLIKKRGGSITQRLAALIARRVLPAKYTSTVTIRVGGRELRTRRQCPQPLSKSASRQAQAL